MGNNELEIVIGNWETGDRKRGIEIPNPGKGNRNPEMEIGR